MSAEDARARANRHALQVIVAAREADLPHVLIGSAEEPVWPEEKLEYPPPFGFHRAWRHSPPNGDWPEPVWQAYEETFRVECGKANVGLILAADYNSDGDVWKCIYAVDLSRWRLKAGKGTITPGVMAGDDELPSSRLAELFERNRPSLRQRLLGH
jgi:hypothetical protein